MEDTSFNFEFLAFRDAVGSDNVYENYSLESLHYFSLSPKWRLALRIDAEIADTVRYIQAGAAW